MKTGKVLKLIMKVRRIIWGFFCALFCWVQIGTGCCATSAEDISLYATSAVLMDADTGRVLYEKNADAPMAMASTTKIMTCILILENGNLEDMVSVSAYAASMPKVKLYIKKGEQYSVKDLLHSLMLESHNDAAVALAEYLGKNYLPEELRTKDTAEYTVEESKQAVAAFAALMNQKAVELGCGDTYFITPNGLDATETITLEDGSTIQKEHHTTAAELARIMSYCIKESPKREDFLSITRTSNYSFTANGRSFSCTNHNAFLSMMDGALSGKTGFTNKAGYCYIGALERDGRTFVVALLACGWPNNKSYKWSDTKELMQYGLDNYFYRSFLEEGTTFDEGLLREIEVAGGRTKLLGEQAYVGVELANAVQEDLPNDSEVENDMENDEGKHAVEGQDGTVEKPYAEPQLEGLLLRADEEIQVEFSQKYQLEAPVRAGTVVGQVQYLVDGTVYRREEIVTTSTVEKIDWKWCAEQIVGRFLLE